MGYKTIQGRLLPTHQPRFRHNASQKIWGKKERTESYLPRQG